MIVIGTNVPSAMAAHHLRNTRDELETAMERLSSGRRINSADDDAAGVGIAQQLMAQVRGTDMARRNAQDAISKAQVAESALVEVENMTQRIRELAVQKASTGTYTATDITNITSEITALNAEILAIKTNTLFNSESVQGAMAFATAYDGSTTSMTFPTFISTAGTTVTTADAALVSIAGHRGSLGAFINRLEYTVNNLSNISANTQAAYSRVMDTDYAAESAKVAKGQVLQQAGAAMLAQANASTQYVTQLLQ